MATVSEAKKECLREECGSLWQGQVEREGVGTNSECGKDTHALDAMQTVEAGDCFLYGSGAPHPGAGTAIKGPQVLPAS